MAAYDEACKKTPTAAYCGLPLYWPAPQFIVSTKAGMHRFSWDLQFDPVSPADLIPAGDEEATGAVPGRTYPNYNVPWVPPGRYTVRLTVDGATKTQPIVVSLDPRVRIAPATLTQLNTLSTALYWEAVAAHRAFNEAKALAATLAWTIRVPRRTPSKANWKPSRRQGSSATSACFGGEAPDSPGRRSKR